MTIQSIFLKCAVPIALLALPAMLIAQEAKPETPEAAAVPEAPAAPAPAADAAPAPAAVEAAPAASEPIASAAPEPAAAPAPAATAQASYPRCSATVTDQCIQVAKRKLVRKARRN
jgi:hypothetical protein